MMYERRRDLRHPIQLAAVVLPGCEAQTEDVSYRGLRLKVDARIVLGRLYRASLAVAGQSPIRLHLVPLRHIVDADGVLRSVAARLLGDEPRWGRFVADLQALCAARLAVAPLQGALGKAAAR